MSVILISMLLRLNEMAETMVAWPIGGAPRITASVNVFRKYCSSQSLHGLQKVTGGRGVEQQVLPHIAGGSIIWGNCYIGKFDQGYENDKGHTMLPPGTLLQACQVAYGTRVFTTAFFIIATAWAYPKCSATEDRPRKLWYRKGESFLH